FTISLRCGERPVISVLDPEKALVCAALVGVMVLGHPEKRPLRGPGILLRRGAAQPLDGLPMRRLLDRKVALLPIGDGSLLLPDAVLCGMSEIAVIAMTSP